jgi:hypothetical protein
MLTSTGLAQINRRVLMEIFELIDESARSGRGQPPSPSNARLIIQALIMCAGWGDSVCGRFKEGELNTTYGELAGYTGLSKDQVKRSLAFLCRINRHTENFLISLEKQQLTQKAGHYPPHQRNFRHTKKRITATVGVCVKLSFYQEVTTADSEYPPHQISNNRHVLYKEEVKNQKKKEHVAVETSGTKLRVHEGEPESVQKHGQSEPENRPYATQKTSKPKSQRRWFNDGLSQVFDADPSEHLPTKVLSRSQNQKPNKLVTREKIPFGGHEIYKQINTQLIPYVNLFRQLGIDGIYQANIDRIHKILRKHPTDQMNRTPLYDALKKLVDNCQRFETVGGALDTAEKEMEDKPMLSFA